MLGALQTNGKFETGAPGVYAIGDCIPGPMLAHKVRVPRSSRPVPCVPLARTILFVW